MASNLWLSREQATVLLELIESCERPLLVHCQWGAERTGLVAAMIELLAPGGTIESARGQFSPYYLFLPVKDGLVMRAHVDRYAAWLRAQGRRHEPEQFRRWIEDHYRPGVPSREQWPYDPYPLAVVTRPAPEPDPAGDRIAGPGSDPTRSPDREAARARPGRR